MSHGLAQGTEWDGGWHDGQNGVGVGMMGRMEWGLARGQNE